MKEDLVGNWARSNVSVHAVTEDSPAVYPAGHDVIDAFCNSENKWKERILAYYEVAAYRKRMGVKDA